MWFELRGIRFLDTEMPSHSGRSHGLQATQLSFLLVLLTHATNKMNWFNYLEFFKHETSKNNLDCKTLRNICINAALFLPRQAKQWRPSCFYSSPHTFHLVKHLRISMQSNRYWIGSIIYLIVLLCNLFEFIDFCSRFLLAGWELTLECIDCGSVMIRWNLPSGSTQTRAGPQLLTLLTFRQLCFVCAVSCMRIM